LPYKSLFHDIHAAFGELKIDLSFPASNRCGFSEMFGDISFLDELVKGRVEGVLYRDVPRSAWRRLDRFEGEMYTRQLVEVWMFHGAPITAEAYIVRPEFLCQLEASEWNFANFLRNGKRPFQRDYSGYRDL